MPHRTYLTAPPGTEPSEATGRAATEPRERYVPGLAAATETPVPSRWRVPAFVATSLVLVLAVVLAAIRLTADAQAQDPSLFVPDRANLEVPTDDEALEPDLDV